MIDEQSVWISIYDHRHGTNVDVYADEASALTGVAQTMRDYLDEFGPNQRRTLKRQLDSGRVLDAIVYWNENHPDDETFLVEVRTIKKLVNP